jgi:hypothetical protein
MTETLGQRQRRFLPLVAKLIDFAYAQGYELTEGEGYRTPEQAALNAQHGSGIANSLHTLRLAVDLQLFKDGIYQTDSAAYKALGDFWKGLDPECAWGGDFQSRPDGNHFSLSWGGIK